ncbi:MAG: HNH endonuclease [Bacillota bacterium]
MANYSGRVFNGIKVLEKLNEKGKHGYRYYRCLCHCGSEFKTLEYNICLESISSCGCGKPVNPGEDGEIKKINNFVYIYKPNHPNCGKDGWMYYHIYLYSQYLGRAIKREENVFHKNGLTEDNRIENLELWSKAILPEERRVEDMIRFCVDYLSEYKPEYLSRKFIKEEKRKEREFKKLKQNLKLLGKSN